MTAIISFMIPVDNSVDTSTAQFDQTARTAASR